MTKVNPLTEKYISSMTAMANHEAQKVALENFKKRGLPHTKMEDWPYTKLSDVLPENISRVTSEADFKDIQTPGKYLIAFSNGRFLESKSKLPAGLEIKKSEPDHKQANDDEADIFAMLNGVLNEETIFLSLAKDTVVDSPISIVHYSNFETEFVTPRIHIVAQKFSQADFVEIFHGENEKKYNVSAVTNFKVEDGAKISHVKVQIEGKSAFHVSSVNADIERDANFTSFTFTTGAKKSRNEMRVRLNQPGGYASVDGLYALGSEQHSDNNSLIAHIKEHTDSSQLFKGVLDDAARGVFTGKVLVCRDAQKVNSEQLNKNLLLTKKSHADTRPQLEVYADDVKCAHGATVGQMNEEETFYLQSRGIQKKRAQKLLLHAFCYEVIEKIENEEIKKYLSQTLFESFEKETFAHLDERE